MAEVKIPTRESSQVDEAFYDDEIQQMRVAFMNGAQYQYYDVDQSTADAMENTPWNSMKERLLNFTRIS